MKAGVVGIGRGIPGQVVANAFFEESLDTTDEWIVRRTGISERRHLEVGRDASELAIEAGREAIADAGITPDQIDLVVVTTITPDYTTPGLAPHVASELGIPSAGAVDLNGACAGFLFGLDYAAGLIESGRSGTVLLIACEILSRLTDFEDRSTAVLFGDGSGAVVLTGGDFARGISRFEFGSEDLIEQLNAPLGGCLQMNGRSVYTHAVDRMSEATRTVLAREGVTLAELDLFIAHQANARILTATGAELGLSEEQVVINVDKLANTSSATIPLALWDAEREGRLNPGDTVGLAAFGAGYVWGAGVIGWKEGLVA